MYFIVFFCSDINTPTIYAISPTMKSVTSYFEIRNKNKCEYARTHIINDVNNGRA